MAEIFIAIQYQIHITENSPASHSESVMSAKKEKKNTALSKNVNGHIEIKMCDK